MRFSVEPMADAKITTLPALSGALLDNKPGRKLCKLRDILNWAGNYILNADEHNRAGARQADGTRLAIVNEKMVRRVRDDFFPWSFKEIPASPNGDGTYKMADGHCEVMGASQRYFSGQCTRDELESEQCVKVIPSKHHLRVYSDINAANTHTASEQIWHPDLAFGEYIETVLLPLLSVDTAEWLHRHKTRGTMLACVSYSLTKNRRDTDEWNLQDVYNLRSRTTDIRNTTEKIKTKQQDALDLANSIDDWYNFLTHLDLETNGQSSKQLQEAKDCTGNPFFGWFLIDRMSANHELSTSNKILAKQVVRQSGNLAVFLPQLLASKGDTIAKNCARVLKILKQKQRKTTSII